MKNNKINESPFEEITVKNDFNWFGGYISEAFDNKFESPIENVEYATFDTDKIDELVTDEDYMWFQDYLDHLSHDNQHEALEYIKNNYPEFLKDEEWNLVEPMKWWSTNKELVDDLENKSAFNRNNVKVQLTQNLFDSYYEDAA